MDYQRFDNLARAVAGERTRRGLLRGLAGAAALWGSGRLFGTSAHHAKAGPGDPCRTDSQCMAADAPMICANNGFGIDGSLNCCTYEGSRCGSDAWCCWDNICVNGFCTGVSANTNTNTISGPGDPCTDSSQCMAADTSVTCDYTLATGDYRCCATIGGRCGWDGGCCGALICDSNTCIANYVGPGDPCQDSSQCLAADTSVTCDYIGQTDDFRCCAEEGGRCGWDGGCCGWMRCSDAGFCTGLPPTGCDGEGCTCDYGAPGSCANGLVCCASQAGFVCATAADCGMA